MVIAVVVMLFWVVIAGYIALSLDGVLLPQETLVKYLHNLPFTTMPTTNGLLLGFVTVGLICLTLAVLPIRSDRPDD